MFLANLFICIFGTFLSAMSGCGTGIIIIPVWLMMGYSLPVGLAVLQLTSVLWCPVAARNYLKSEKLDYKLLVGLLIAGLSGTFVGASSITRLDQSLVNKLVGLVVIATSLIINFVNPEKTAKSLNLKSNLRATILAFPLGVYEAAFGAGNAILTSFVLIKFKGFELSKGLGYYYLVATFWCFSSAVIYLLSGFTDWSLLIAATAGSIIGAELGSKFGKTKCSKFLKKSILLAGIVLGVRLLVFS